MANVSDMFGKSPPLYRQRMAMRRPSDQAVLDDPLKVAQIFHYVFGSPEGQKVLDIIVRDICHVDAPYTVSDALGMADANGRRNVGLRILELALAPFDDTKPEVKG
jgi:hypothetical protein